MYASLVGNGVRLLNDKTIAAATKEQSSGRDEVLWVNNRFGLGFTLNSNDGNLGQEGAFGHSGAGGSLGFADPKAEIGFDYMINQMPIRLPASASIVKVGRRIKLLRTSSS